MDIYGYNSGLHQLDTHYTTCYRNWLKIKKVKKEKRSHATLKCIRELSIFS